MSITSLQPGPSAPEGSAPFGRFMRRYTGRNARRYEAKRQGRCWTAEATAFEHLYAKVNPRMVLDCPIGTGRWMDTYQRYGAAVLGVDMSPDMLAEAVKKLGPRAELTLKRCNLLDSSQAAALGCGYDLIVCTRFLHWVSRQDLPVLVESLSATKSRFLLVGAQTDRNGSVPRERPVQRTWLASLKQLRLWLRGHAPNHVHDEASLLRNFRAGGWEIVEKRSVTKRRGSQYSFYLFRMGAKSKGA